MHTVLKIIIRRRNNFKNEKNEKNLHNTIDSHSIYFSVSTLVNY